MEETRQFNIEGMHCASCANRIQEKVRALPGVESGTVNFATKKLSLVGEVADLTLFREVEAMGYRLSKPSSTRTDQGEEKNLKRDLTVAAVFTLPVFVTSMMMWHSAGILVLQWICTLPVLWAGRSFYVTAFRLLKSKSANMDTLVALGTMASLLYSAFETASGGMETYLEAATVIITFVLLGRYLELRARGAAGNAIRKLMDLNPTKALRIKNGKVEEVSLEMLHLEDLVQVRIGEKIPSDGIIQNGRALINEAMITGESLPVEKKEGDAVIGGTLLINGSLEVVIKKLGKETLLSQIISLVENAQNSKARIERLADWVSARFVPVVLVVALLTLGGWLLSGHSLGDSLLPAIAVLVIACPCAMGLATPAAVMVGTGRAASLGILIKSAESLERAHTLNILVFDKTGTLTEGRPRVVDAKKLSDFSEEELLPRICALEKLSTHPFSHALVEYCKLTKGYKVEGFHNETGQGIRGKVAGIDLWIGRPGADEKFEVSGSPVVVRSGEKNLFVFGVQDEIQKSALEAVRALKLMGIEPVMATGDAKETAEKVGEKLGIENIHARLFPKDKENLVREFRDHALHVGVVGDGINDAPMMALADVSFAMGTGTDVAKETASITLVKGNLKKVSEAIQLSRATVRIIKENLFWAFLYNTLAIPMAAFGRLSPMIASLAMAMSSVTVVLNSLRIKRVKL